MEYTKNELIQMLLANNAKQPKAHYSNNVIVQMLETLNDDFKADVETVRGGVEMVNRGSLVECIIKATVYGVAQVEKSACNNSDLNTSKLNAQQLALVHGVKSSNIEVKFSTSFAPATKKTNKARKTIIVCERGIYMIDSKNIVATSAGKININNQKHKDLDKLQELMDLLGF